MPDAAYGETVVDNALGKCYIHGILAQVSRKTTSGFRTVVGLVGAEDDGWTWTEEQARKGCLLDHAECRAVSAQPLTESG